MPDQACTYFDDLINVYEYGREFSLKEFGNMTRIGWHVDTFGHSSSMARILAEMGYDYESVFRINLQRREEIENKGNLMINWIQRYPEMNLPTYVMPVHYAPINFYREQIEFKQIVFSVVNPHFDGLEITRKHYVWMHYSGDQLEHTNVPVFMGDDFAFSDAEYQYYVYQNAFIFLKSNDKSAFKGGYLVSHVEDLLKAMKEENIPLESFRGDLLPMVGEFSRDGMVSWAGFFHGRPGMKKDIKQTAQTIRGITNYLGYLRLKNLIQKIWS